MTGGNFSLTGGFWSGSVVQTPGGPLLSILLTSPNTARILWPSPSAGFTLQQSADLKIGNWGPVPELVSDDGTHKFIVVNPATDKRFYRLFKP